MSDLHAFLRAIRASPDDDTARLVFADWLDEHDDPLGEFIRVQIELEPIRHRIDNRRALELHRREEEILRAHRDEWITTSALLTDVPDFGPVFRRGLPDYACLSLDTFLTSGEALFEAYPTLREVALYGVANRCDELTACPLLEKLDTLEIADWPTRDDVAALAVSPYLDVPRFRLWIGGEALLLLELARQADQNWPQEIELVQVYGGAAAGSPQTARELNEQVDRLARRVNQEVGRPLVRVTRPFDQIFPLDGDLGYNLCAGHLPDGNPALAAGSFTNWILVVFNEDGRVKEVAVRESPVPADPDLRRYGEVRSALDSAFEDWVDEELRLELGLIWVREFSVENLSVALWPWRFGERIANWAPFPATPQQEAGWRDRGGEARGWLESRNFVINWGNDYYADWRGKIHSS